MTEPKEEPKLQMVCGNCGTTDVMRDAWAAWDVETQDWGLRAVFDYGHCDRCGRETSIEEQPLEE